MRRLITFVTSGGFFEKPGQVDNRATALSAAWPTLRTHQIFEDLADPRPHSMAT
jgi:hypothetical protein